MKRKGKGKMTWIIVIAIAAGLGIFGVTGWTKLSKEHKEARSLPLDRVDFSKLADGVYDGSYEGGMYNWRENKARVTVSSGKVNKIELLESKLTLPAEKREELFSRVIKAQSLQVDAISGATLDSKAYLQAVENALVNAQAK
jgi:uncharacterized protein with FMN-binding domain